ncbi:hypothetical protein Tco_0433968, partial [Tanacetum coccineum]
MSADSAITYTSVHSEARSWSIPSGQQEDHLSAVRVEIEGIRDTSYSVRDGQPHDFAV